MTYSSGYSFVACNSRYPKYSLNYSLHAVCQNFVTVVDRPPILSTCLSRKIENSFIQKSLFDEFMTNIICSSKRTSFVKEKSLPVLISRQPRRSFSPRSRSARHSGRTQLGRLPLIMAIICNGDKA
jgi:hypothetical protein